MLRDVPFYIKKWLFIAVWFSVAVVSCTGKSLAQEVRSIDTFAHRLLKDPFDRDAHAYFEQLADQDSQILPTERMKLLRIKELLAYLEFLNKRLVNLKKEGTEFSQNHFSAIGDKEAITLEQIIVVLSGFKDELAKQVKEAQSSSSRISKVPEKIAVKEEPSVRREMGGIEMLRGELVKLHKRFDDLTQRINLAEQKAQRLTEDVTTKTLELFEKDEVIERQKEKLMTLEQKLEELQQRLTLGQRLIQEKSEQIRRFEVNLSKPQVISSGETVHRSDLDQLQNQITRLKEELHEQIKTSKARMSVLERLLAEQEKRMAEYALELKSKGEKIDQLTHLVFEKSKEVSELNAVLQSKDQKLLELDGIIQIYKGKLTESNKLLREKIDQIKTLEEQLAQTHQRVYSSKIDLKKIAEQLINLRDKLKELP